jgi:uncharacterized protein (TIGR03086 family)
MANTSGASRWRFGRLATVTDLVSLFERSVEEFGRRVRAVADSQWDAPTPDEGWSVRDLVQHLVSEELWAPPLLAGSTIEDVGDRFDGDLVGDDPKDAWEAAARGAVEAARADAPLSRTVHVSFGDITAEDYLTQLTGDHTIHAWDLARAIGADETLDPELVELAYVSLEPQVEQLRGVGIFGAKVEAPAGASRQAQLLALTGRKV